MHDEHEHCHHDYDGGHEHHEHCHHDHDEQDGHHATHGEDSSPKIQALLTYMMEHNHSHAGELAAVAEKLSEMGEGPAAERLKAGVKDFEAGNEKLAQALSLIKKDNA